MRETTKLRTFFEEFIKKNECDDGQICSTVKKFRRDLMIPIIKMIQELEKKADEY